MSYPEQWKVELGVPIPKSNSTPPSEDSIRVVSMTHFFSKLYESFLVQWLLPYIQPFLDPGQCGGLKNLSVNHYLIRLVNFIHSSLDTNQNVPKAVLAIMVDMSKAFNRVDHSLCIEDLYDMKCPSWLLNVIFSYL